MILEARDHQNFLDGKLTLPDGYEASLSESKPTDLAKETEAVREFVRQKELRKQFGRFQTLWGRNGVLTRITERLGLEQAEDGTWHYPAKGIPVEWPARAAGDD